MNNDIRKYFYSRFPQEGESSGVGIIKEIKEEIKNIEKETDLKRKYEEVSFSCKKHNDEFNTLSGYYNHYIWEDAVSRGETIDKYKEWIDKLEKLREETHDELDKFNKNQRTNRPSQFSCCSWCKLAPPTKHYIYNSKTDQLKVTKKNASKNNQWLFCSESHFEKWKKKNHYCCAECLEEKWDGKYKKSKKDKQKFCSSNCFYKHYAETCDNCLEKCVSSYQNKATGFAQTYYSNPQNKTGILCSKCHQEQLKELSEEERKDKEWEENFKRIDKNMKNLVDGMEDAVRGDSEDESNSEDNLDNDKSNQIKSNQIKSNQIKSNQIKSNQIWVTFSLTLSPPWN